jgi:hypothetical protein
VRHERRPRCPALDFLPSLCPFSTELIEICFLFSNMQNYRYAAIREPYDDVDPMPDYEKVLTD